MQYRYITQQVTAFVFIIIIIIIIIINEFILRLLQKLSTVSALQQSLKRTNENIVWCYLYCLIHTVSTVELAADRIYSTVVFINNDTFATVTSVHKQTAFMVPAWF